MNFSPVSTEASNREHRLLFRKYIGDVNLFFTQSNGRNVVFIIISARFNNRKNIKGI